MTITTSSRRQRRWRRPLLTLAGVTAAGLALLPPGVAAAHVRVIPDNPTSGGFSVLTFRVPNESDTAGTVKISVKLPQDTPFVYVSTKPLPGWTVSAPKEKLPKPYDLDGTTITEAVRTVTWSAEKGTQIAPGEYQELSISVGPLPDPGTVLLPAIQTYSDGKVVAWDQPATATGEEPEHPAPAIEIVAAAPGADDHGGTATATDSTEHDAEDPAAGTSSGFDPVARALAGVGLVAGVGALVVSLLALRRRSA